MLHDALRAKRGVVILAEVLDWLCRVQAAVLVGTRDEVFVLKDHLIQVHVFLLVIELYLVLQQWEVSPWVYWLWQQRKRLLRNLNLLFN